MSMPKAVKRDKLEYTRFPVHLVKQHLSSHIHAAFYSRVFDEDAAGYKTLLCNQR